jgi:hypothetical protein
MLKIQDQSIDGNYFHGVLLPCLPKSAGRKKRYNNDRKNGNPHHKEFVDI